MCRAVISRCWFVGGACLRRRLAATRLAVWLRRRRRRRQIGFVSWGRCVTRCSAVAGARTGQAAMGPPCRESSHLAASTTSSIRPTTTPSPADLIRRLGLLLHRLLTSRDTISITNHTHILIHTYRWMSAIWPKLVCPVKREKALTVATEAATSICIEEFVNQYFAYNAQLVVRICGEMKHTEMGEWGKGNARERNGRDSPGKIHRLNYTVHVHNAQRAFCRCSYNGW